MRLITLIKTPRARSEVHLLSYEKIAGFVSLHIGSRPMYPKGKKYSYLKPVPGGYETNQYLVRSYIGGPLTPYIIGYQCDLPAIRNCVMISCMDNILTNPHEVLHLYVKPVI